jgi:hypothetical protein
MTYTKIFYLKTISADQAIDIRLINSRGEAIATQGESLVISVDICTAKQGEAMVTQYHCHNSKVCSPVIHGMALLHTAEATGNFTTQCCLLLATFMNHW